PPSLRRHPPTPALPPTPPPNPRPAAHPSYKTPTSIPQRSFNRRRALALLELSSHERKANMTAVVILVNAVLAVFVVASVVSVHAWAIATDRGFQRAHLKIWRRRTAAVTRPVPART